MSGQCEEASRIQLKSVTGSAICRSGTRQWLAVEQTLMSHGVNVLEH